MKRFFAAMLILALTIGLLSTALANGWNLTGGPLLEQVSLNTDYQDYTAVAEFYQKDSKMNAAVMYSQRANHSVLMTEHESWGMWVMCKSTPAVYQKSQGKGTPALESPDDDTLILSYGEKERYTFSFSDQFGDPGLYLSAAQKGEVSLNLDAEAWRYTVNAHLRWMVEPIALEAFNIDLFPDTEEAVTHLNEVYAYLTDASGFWQNNWVYGKQQGNVPVYAAPDHNAYRAANGKASVAPWNGVQLLASVGDWQMIEYDISYRANRIGFVESKYLRESAPIFLTDVPVRLTAALTDDPNVSGRELAAADTLRDVHLLAQLGPFYGLVSAVNTDGKAVWGFAPLNGVQLPKYAVQTDVMAELAGTWAFAGGGNLTSDVLLLRADGTGEACGIAEGAEEWYYEGGELTEEQMTDERAPFTWEVQAGLEVQYLVLRWADGGVERFAMDVYQEEETGMDILSLLQGEGGGGWARIDTEQNAHSAGK